MVWPNDRYPVRVDSLAPDIVSPLTCENYRFLKDPAFEAIIEIETSED